MEFSVSLSNPSSLITIVDYETLDGTATAITGDYDATSGTLVFAPGETFKIITVLVNGDTRAEPTEAMFVRLSNPLNATIPAVVSVNLDQAALDTVSVDYSTSNGSAVAFDVINTGPAQPDYYQAAGTLTFAPGRDVQDVTVLVNGDSNDAINSSF